MVQDIQRGSGPLMWLEPHPIHKGCRIVVVHPDLFRAGERVMAEAYIYQVLTEYSGFDRAMIKPAYHLVEQLILDETKLNALAGRLSCKFQQIVSVIDLRVWGTVQGILDHLVPKEIA